MPGIPGKVAPDTQTVVGTVTRVIWQNPSQYNYLFSIAPKTEGFDAEVKVLGKAPFHIRPGACLKIEGYFRVTAKYGRDFMSVSIEEEKPVDETGMIAFLKSRIDGIGDVTARRLVERFGTNLPQVLTETPDLILQVPGMSPTRMKQIIASWKASESDREILMFFTRLGLSMNRAVRAKDFLGPKAIEKVKENPYVLLDVETIGIVQADQIFFRLGGRPEDSKRVYAFIRFAIIEATQSVGHVFLYEKEIYDWIQRMVKHNSLMPIPGLNPARVMLHVDQIKDTDHLIRDENRVYTEFLYRAERESASQLSLRRFKTVLPENFPLEPFVSSCEEEMGLKFSPEQRDFLLGFFNRSIHVLTGKPGTGKTTVTNALVKLLRATNLTFALCAPTGMAAKRLSQLSGHQAYTIHRYLGATGTAWLHNADNPRNEAVVIVDEMSMVDQTLLYRLLDGTETTTRFIFIGDAEQLPSVGPGNVLQELMDCGKFNLVRLSRIYRQDEDSLIVENAHRVSSGLPPIYDREKGFVLAPGTGERFIKLLDAVHDRIIQRGALSFMILSPRHDGDYGVTRINQYFQSKVNPPDGIKKEVEGSLYLFREGDRIVVCRNNYDKGVVNGDQGSISAIDVEGRKLILNIEDVGAVDYDFNELGDLRLAYCLSVHKAQGSQAEWVVVVVQPEQRTLLSRRLFYTAITRAQKKVVILGDESSVSYAVGNTRVNKRNSNLGNLLKACCLDES